jgi:hypothetical protein
MDSSDFALQDFGTLNVGQTECHTIFFQNKSAKVVIIQSVYTNGGGFTATPIPSIPSILLQNEIISIANLCFSPQDPTNSTASSYLQISYTIDQAYGNINAAVTGHQVIDTLLNRPCATASIDADLFGPIIMDGDVTHTVTITSNRHTTINVVRQGVDSNATSADDKAFVITGITFPYKLAPLEVKTFNVTCPLFLLQDNQCQ